MNDLELFREILERIMGKPVELRVGWNKGTICVHIVFEDGRIQSVEAW